MQQKKKNNNATLDFSIAFFGYLFIQSYIFTYFNFRTSFQIILYYHSF